MLAKLFILILNAIIFIAVIGLCKSTIGHKNRPQYQSKLPKHQRGNVLLTVMVFALVMTITLRWISPKTINENNATQIFVNDSQNFYYSENLLALMREYAHRLNHDPQYPNIFLSASAYAENSVSRLIDFNKAFDLKQIAPEDMAWRPASFSCSAGPIFWKENTRYEDGFHHISEVVLLGSINYYSDTFNRYWTTYVTQLMEIERKPLTDFGIFSEGDLSILAPLGNVNRPVQVNGNLRIATKAAHEGTTNFKKKVNVAGRCLDQNNWKNVEAFPEKHELYELQSHYNTLTPDFLKQTHTISYLKNKDKNSKDAIKYNVFDLRAGTIFRPSGFYPKRKKFIGLEKPSKDMFLERLTGSYNLCDCDNSKEREFNQYGNWVEAYGKINGSLLEKINLVRLQKPANFPCLEVTIILTSNTLRWLGNLERKVSYVNYTTAAANDRSFLKEYYDLILKKSPRIVAACDFYSKQKNAKAKTYFKFPELDPKAEASPVNPKSKHPYYNTISDNKLAMHTRTNNGIKLIYTDKESKAPPPTYQGFSFYLKETTNKISDLQSPPSVLKRTYDEENRRYYWESALKINAIIPERFDIFFDRNRQCVDIDMKTFKDWADQYRNFSYYDNTLVLNRQCLEKLYKMLDQNYKAKSGADIRTSTFGKYSGESTNFPIDIGVRITNAEEIPNGGMSIISEFPLYIQGNYNTKNFQKNSLIIADSITVLSNNWASWSSKMDPLNSKLRKPLTATNITIGANLITGASHVDYWPTNKFSDAGVHVIHVLEPNLSIKLKGSLLIPYCSRIQWEPSLGFHEVYCNYNMTFDDNMNETLATSCTPVYYKVQRGRLTQQISQEEYQNLLNLIYKQQENTTTAVDWTGKSYTDYLTALPNFLQDKTQGIN